MTDLEIARKVELLPILEIAQKIGISPDVPELYGKYKAKLPLDIIDNEKIKKSKLILVSAISPTPAGEGKTTTSIGLTEGMNRLGHKTIAVLREPSLGPVFGMKGGATGGGYSQVIPMEDINLHFTGDFSAIEKANNLLAALIDNNIQSKKHSLNIDPRTVSWKRVMDMNDRSLRNIVIGLGGTSFGIPRETGFNITAASEVMAILCLAENLADLKHRLNNIFVGFTFDKKPIYARDLNAGGAMATLLKDAIKPNLVQTIEGNAAILHGGPFANIAQGTNSVLATKIGLSLADYVVTEAGFGFDLGAEKFIDIKCRSANIFPSAVVLVATIRALKYHGDMPLDKLKNSDLKYLEQGFENLEKHIENIRQFHLTPIVAINRFLSDTEEEIELVCNWCKELGVKVALADVWGKGGEGALKLAELVVEAASNSIVKPNFLYELNWSMEKKIETIAHRIYGANAVDFTAKAKSDLERIERIDLSHLPICMAKTQKSLSDNPLLLGRPKDFVVTVSGIEIASGAGFVIPITGDILRMPGLPEIPSAESIDIDENGVISGLF